MIVVLALLHASALTTSATGVEHGLWTRLSRYASCVAAVAAIAAAARCCSHGAALVAFMSRRGDGALGNQRSMLAREATWWTEFPCGSVLVFLAACAWLFRIFSHPR